MGIKGSNIAAIRDALDLLEGSLISGIAENRVNQAIIKLYAASAVSTKLLDALNLLLTHTVDADLAEGIELTDAQSEARDAALAAIEAAGEANCDVTSTIPEKNSIFLLAQRGLEDLGVYLADNDPLKDGYSQEEADEMRNLLQAGPALLAKMEGCPS